MIGNTIGSYSITSFIGEGGMGNVWEGKHNTIDRKVAIKVLHPQYARNEKIRERFRREAKTLAKLHHPNIVTLYDLVETTDQICLVMELVEGVNLEDYIKTQTGPLPNTQLGPIFKQILSAIGYAHSQQIIHRDIKPSNFMITPEGNIKVLDFGIAKLLEDENALTKTGTRMGTTLFMSPEQVLGQPVDHRTDIYALGVTLFVLATGTQPYQGSTTDFQVYQAIVNEPLPDPRSVYPGVTPSVAALIQKATAKKPEDRYQNCSEFLTVGTSPTKTHAQEQIAPPNFHQSTPPPNSNQHSDTQTRYFKQIKGYLRSSTILFLLIAAIELATGVYLLNSYANSYESMFSYDGNLSDTYLTQLYFGAIGTSLIIQSIGLGITLIPFIGLFSRKIWGRILFYIFSSIFLAYSLLGFLGNLLTLPIDHIPDEIRLMTLVNILGQITIIIILFRGIFLLGSSKAKPYFS